MPCIDRRGADSLTGCARARPSCRRCSACPSTSITPRTPRIAPVSAGPWATCRRWPPRAPYFRARMRLRAHDAEIQLTSTRSHRGVPMTRFEGSWGRGEPLLSPSPDWLACFLVERYCLYTVHWRQLSRVRIFPLPLAPPPRQAALLHVDHAGIPGPANPTRGPAHARAGGAPPGVYLAPRAAQTYDPAALVPAAV